MLSSLVEEFHLEGAVVEMEVVIPMDAKWDV